MAAMVCHGQLVGIISFLTSRRLCGDVRMMANAGILFKRRHLHDVANVSLAVWYVAFVSNRV